MRIFDDELAVLARDVDAPKVLDMAAGHVYDLLKSQYGGYFRTKVYDIPVGIFTLTLPDGIKLAAPDCEIEVTDLNKPLASGLISDHPSKPELLSLSGILAGVRAMMILNNMGHPHQYTTYQ